jgi:hypothetical protein
MKTFVVRILRSEGRLRGTVNDVATGDTVIFTSDEALIEAVSPTTEAEEANQ